MQGPILEAVAQLTKPNASDSETTQVAGFYKLQNTTLMSPNTFYGY